VDDSYDKSSPLRQSVIDLRNEFDEIAEEGECLFSWSLSQGDIGREDYDSSDSFCFIPSKSEPSQLAIKEENSILRSGMKKRLENAERMLKLRQEQDQQLRENIAVARREVFDTP
jgi:hypothetical protein